MSGKLANTAVEWDSMRASDRTDVVRTPESWASSVKTMAAGHPLARCDAQCIESFTTSLKFKDGALGHADYSMLVDNLTYKEFSDLWAMFGMSMEYFIDHQNYRCTSPGNCAAQYYNICTSSC